MKTKLIIVLVTIFFFGALESLPAQDLGPQFKKVSEGIYVYAAVLNEANSTIVLTQDGVVLIDTGQSPKDSHVVMAAVKKLTAGRCESSFILSRTLIMRWAILFFHRPPWSSRMREQPPP